MPWRAKCYECQREAGISRPFFETKDEFLAFTLLEQKILEKAVAHYAPHPRSAADARPCSGVGMPVPRAHILLAHSTTPDDDPPTWGRQIPRPERATSD